MVVINHDIRANNGKYIVMPPHKLGQSGWGNLAIPNTTSPGGDTAAVYPVNTKFVDFDRSFIYGYVSGVDESTKANIGLFNSGRQEVITWGATAGVLGDTKVGILANTLDVETTAAANIFAGGYLMPRTNPYSDYRIISNTKYDEGRVTGEMDIVIEDGLTAAVTASQASCYLDKNPFLTMWQHWGHAVESQSVVGVTLIIATASTYQWVQTFGPVHIPSDEVLGSGSYIRDGFFAGDGSILGATTAILRQYAGPAISGGTNASAFQMTWLVKLQLER
ncbi:hypothetical protein LCGC14_0392820 [marine sediment metagenome]|uniref:Uncharacterized protein n=1 Tax=marine sediment metagenome TaxID=412755 RepID=A0A0F9VL09_9ZZZZ